MKSALWSLGRWLGRRVWIYAFLMGLEEGFRSGWDERTQARHGITGASTCLRCGRVMLTSAFLAHTCDTP